MNIISFAYLFLKDTKRIELGCDNFKNTQSDKEDLQTIP